MQTLEDKSVLFVGLSPKAWNPRLDLRWAADNEAEMWTLNNFYAAEWLKPYYFDKAFQIHEDDLGSYWMDNYRMAGCVPVVCATSRQIGEIREKLPNRIEVDIYELERAYGTLMCSSSWNYMFHLALSGRFSKIKIAGVDLKKGSGYEYQIPGVLAWLKFLRDCGVEVDCPLEDSWRITYGTIRLQDRQRHDGLAVLNEGRPIDTLYGSLSWSRVRNEMGFKTREEL